MSIEQDLAAARTEIAALRGDLADTEQEHLSDAQRQAALFAAELLACSVTIAGMDGTDRSELDVALDAVRDKAQEVGLLRHRPPHPVD